MSTHTLRVGDRVVVDPEVARAHHRGVTYRVTRLLPVRVDVEPEDGGRGMRIHPQHLLPAPADGSPAPTLTTIGVPHRPQPAPLAAGTLVTATGLRGNPPPEQLYVVLRYGDGRASIAKLGGDNGRYWRGAARGRITVIDPGRVRLAAA